MEQEQKTKAAAKRVDHVDETTTNQRRAEIDDLLDEIDEVLEEVDDELGDNDDVMEAIFEAERDQAIRDIAQHYLQSMFGQETTHSVGEIRALMGRFNLQYGVCVC